MNKKSLKKSFSNANFNFRLIQGYYINGGLFSFYHLISKEFLDLYDSLTKYTNTTIGEIIKKDNFYSFRELKKADIIKNFEKLNLSEEQKGNFLSLFDHNFLYKIKTHDEYRVILKLGMDTKMKNLFFTL